MGFEVTEINSTYSSANTDAIAAIAKENTSAANSDVSSIYENQGSMDIDAAVLSISDKGIARINAMLSKSIKLSAYATNPTLSLSERQDVRAEINHIRAEIDDIRSEEEAEQMVADSSKKIIQYASESIKTQNSNRESVLQLL